MAIAESPIVAELVTAGLQKHSSRSNRHQRRLAVMLEAMAEIE
jgi:hypothetical protein